MRLNIDKLMIGFVMILAVCLYAPTLLEDYKANNTTNEKVTEVLAEALLPSHLLCYWLCNLPITQQMRR